MDGLYHGSSLSTWWFVVQWTGCGEEDVLFGTLSVSSLLDGNNVVLNFSCSPLKLLIHEMAYISSSFFRCKVHMMAMRFCALTDNLRTSTFMVK